MSSSAIKKIGTHEAILTRFSAPTLQAKQQCVSCVCVLLFLSKRDGLLLHLDPVCQQSFVCTSVCHMQLNIALVCSSVASQHTAPQNTQQTTTHLRFSSSNLRLRPASCASASLTSCTANSASSRLRFAVACCIANLACNASCVQGYRACVINVRAKKCNQHSAYSFSKVQTRTHTCTYTDT